VWKYWRSRSRSSGKSNLERSCAFVRRVYCATPPL
jgi:hypothetical protein